MYCIGIHLEEKWVRIAVLQAVENRFIITKLECLTHQDFACPTKLSQLIQEYSGHKENISIVLPAYFGLVGKFSIPFIDEEQIAQVLPYALEDKILSRSMDDLILDSTLLSKSESKSKILLGALPKNRIEQCLSFSTGGLFRPQFLDLDIMATQLFLDQTSSSNYQVILHLERKACNITIFQNGIIDKVRTFIINPSSVGDILQHDVEETQEMAVWKPNELSLKDWNYISRRVLPEIRRTLFLCESPDSILYCGILTKNQSAQWAKELDIPFQPLISSEDITAESSKNPIEYAAAIGAAKKILQPKQGFNFRKHEYVYINRLDILRLPSAIFLTLLAALLLFIGYYFHQTTQNLKSDFQQIVTQSEKTAIAYGIKVDEVPYLDRVYAILDEMEATNFREEIPKILDSFEQISQVSKSAEDTRKKFYFTIQRITCGQEEVSIEGKTADMTFFDTLAKNLEKMEGIRNKTQIQLNFSQRIPDAQGKLKWEFKVTVVLKNNPS